VSCVQSVQAPPAVQPSVQPSAGPVVSAVPSLLPAPSGGALGGCDALSMLYLFESKDRQDGESVGAHKVQGLETDRNKALQDEQKAITQQDEAMRDKSCWDNLGNLCGEVAKVAGVVASIATAVGTCGAATPLAALAIGGAVLSTAGFVDGETHVLQSLGIDERTADGIDMGLSLGGLAGSVGAGIAAGETVASRTTEVVSRTASVAAGVTAVGKGAAEIGSGQALARLDRADADQIAAAADSGDLQRQVLCVIGEVRSDDDQAKQILSTIASTKTLQNQTAVGAAIAVKG
jgi:hypothetical protein